MDPEIMYICKSC